jgi:hypothetical protein
MQEKGIQLVESFTPRQSRGSPRTAAPRSENIGSRWRRKVSWFAGDIGAELATVSL